MRALTIVYILLACTVAGFSQTTATYDNVRARQQLTLNGHTLTSVLQTIDSLSTHAQGVTAKAVYDYIATKYSTVSAGTGIDVVKSGSNYTISLDTLKRLHFRTDSTYTGGVGTMRWNLTDGTLDLGLLGGNVTLQLGQESVQRVKHADNSGLVQGRVVYLVGSDGTNPTVRYARANTYLTSANTFGVITEDASGGSKAFCTTFGLVRNINTNNLTEGGLVWLSKDTAGAMTAVRPTAPNHGVEIGFCIRKHATQGVVFVTVQNGYELNELHDVYAPSPSNNQGLLWKSANLRWEAAAVDTSLNNEGRLIGFKPSNNSYYNIGSSTNGSSPIILYRGSGIGFSGTSGSPEGGDLTISNTGDLDSGNEGILGVGAGTSTSSVITSNTSGASGVTINASGGISISETTSSNGGSINLSATDQSISNEGILGVAINPGADAWLRSNTSTANDIGLVGTNNTTITATASSNGGQIVIDSKAQIDTFSVSGSTLSLSLKNDGEPAKTVTLPGGGGGATVTGTGVAGRAAFWRSTSSISSDENFAWDSTNVRLNIGAPSSSTGKLNVKGSGNTSSTVNSVFTNSSNTDLLRIRDDGSTGVNYSTPTSLLDIRARQSYATVGTTELASSFASSVPGDWTGSGNTWTHVAGNTSTLTATVSNTSFYRVIITVGAGSGSLSFTLKGYSSSTISSTTTFDFPQVNTSNLVITPSSDLNRQITVSVVSITAMPPISRFINNADISAVDIKTSGGGVPAISIGSSSGSYITSGSGGVYIGSGAGASVTTGGGVAIGTNAASNSSRNTGWLAIGNNSAANNATGINWVSIGGDATISNVSGGSFVSIGVSSARNVTASSNFVSIGSSAAQGGTTSTSFVAIGSDASYGNTTGSNYVSIGTNAGRYITGGITNATATSNSVYIGHTTKASSASPTNEIVIGYQAEGIGSNSTVIGNTSTTQTHLYGNATIGLNTTASARLHVQGASNTSTTYSFIATNSGGSTTTPAICAQNDQKVGIGTNSVDSGATLEVDGTTGGILFPRLTTTQRDALTPTNGLVIYNSTTDKLQVRAGGAWVDLH